MNSTNVDMQLKIWLTDKHLKGQVLSSTQVPNKYHIYEKHHCFIEYKGIFYRYNEIWREELIQGRILNVEKITSNFAPVLYNVDETYLIQNGAKVWHIDETYRLSTLRSYKT
jgi:vancomycin resistance protein VanW